MTGTVIGCQPIRIAIDKETDMNLLLLLQYALLLLGGFSYLDNTTLTPEDAHQERRGICPEVTSITDEELLDQINGVNGVSASRELGIRYRTYDSEARQLLTEAFVAHAEPMEASDKRSFVLAGRLIFLPDEFIEMLRQLYLDAPVDQGEHTIVNFLAWETAGGTRNYGQAGAQLLLDIHAMVRKEEESTGESPIFGLQDVYYLAFGACGDAGVSAIESLGDETNNYEALALAFIGTDRAAELLVDEYNRRPNSNSLMNALVQFQEKRKVPAVRDAIRQGLPPLLDETNAVGTLCGLVHTAGRAGDPYLIPYLERTRLRIQEFADKGPSNPNDPNRAAVFQEHLDNLPGEIDAAIAKIQAAQEKTENARTE